MRVEGHRPRSQLRARDPWSVPGRSPTLAPTITARARSPPAARRPHRRGGMKQPTAGAARDATASPATSASSTRSRSRVVGAARFRPRDAYMVVDAARVHQPGAGRLGHEHRRLRRDPRLRPRNQAVLRIPEGAEGITILGDVAPDRRHLLGGIGVDEPERHALPREALVEAPHLGRIAVRDRAVRPREHEDGDRHARGVEGNRAPAVQVDQGQGARASRGLGGAAAAARSRPDNAQLIHPPRAIIDGWLSHVSTCPGPPRGIRALDWKGDQGKARRAATSGSTTTTRGG